MAVAKKPKTKKRRRVTRHLSTAHKPVARRRRKSPVVAKRKSPRRLRDSGMKVKPMDAAKKTIAATAGGATYAAPQFLFHLPTYGKVIWGLGGAFLLHMFKAHNVASGHAGAMTFDLIHTNFATSLKDGQEEVNWVDADTLSDTGFEDAKGNAVVKDPDGNVYALNDHGEYEHIGHEQDMHDAYSLNDGEDGHFDLQSVSMLPLQDRNPYALNAGNPYALQGNYM